MSLCPSLEHCDDKQTQELLQETSDLGTEERNNSQWAYQTDTKPYRRWSSAMLAGAVSLSFT